MKKAALWFMSFAFSGAIVLAWPAHDPPPEPMPLPGKALSVRIPIRHGEPGSYSVEIGMPKVGSSLTAIDGTIQCSFLIEVDPGKKDQQSFAPSSIKGFAEYGFAKVIYYHAGPDFILDQRDHVVQISQGEGCPVAAERGATVAVTKDVGDPAAYLFSNLLRYAAAVVALFSGLLGVTIVVLRAKVPAI